MNTGSEHSKENLIPAFCVEDLTLAYREKPVLWDIYTQLGTSWKNHL